MSEPREIAREEALDSIRRMLRTGLPPASRAWWSQTEAKVEAAVGPSGSPGPAGPSGSASVPSSAGGTSAGDAEVLDVVFPALARRCGREPLVEPTSDARFLRTEGCLLDLAAYRHADAAALLLVDKAIAAGQPPRLLRRLYDQGDMDERISVMRCLPWIGDDPVVLDLLGEAQRCNTRDVYEAAWCDHDLAARRLPDDDFNRMVLKLAFSDIPFWRVIGGLRRANPELSRMLQDFATEREAAGRPIWVDTLRLIARAPVDGTHARLIGHLEHGKDALRLAVAESIVALPASATERATVHARRQELVRYVQERLARERHPDVRSALETALRQLEA